MTISDVRRRDDIRGMTTQTALTPLFSRRLPPFLLLCGQ
jgi:hypothetical protein